MYFLERIECIEKRVVTKWTAQYMRMACGTGCTGTQAVGTEVLIAQAASQCKATFEVNKLHLTGSSRAADRKNIFKYMRDSFFYRE
jgi:hypothetical protein